MIYLGIEEVAGRSERGYPRKVRRMVLSRLVQRGLLTGQIIDGKPCVQDDAALHHFLGFGIENFVYNTQGWCFIAVHAPLSRVAAAIQNHNLTRSYALGITPLPLGDNMQVHPQPDRREVFLLKLHGSDWTVIVQTVHWIRAGDPLLALVLAADLSQSLRTHAIAMWDDDFSGSHLVVCENGRKTRYLCEETDDWEEMQAFIYECGIHVPRCFIATNGYSARLHVSDPAIVAQADHASLAIPDESRIKVPHPMRKLVTMAGAFEDEIETETAFCHHIVDGLWKQVTALRAPTPAA